ncbi:MAG: porin [Gammaproteobacteria bacterium]
MKKSPVTLAIAAALPAFAQAQTNIVLNGSLDMSLESVNNDANDGNGTDLKVANGVWGGSTGSACRAGLGTVRLGRQYTPMRRALAPGDTTDYSWYNNADGLAGTATRFSNDVSYQSPSMGGFTLHAAYASGEAPNDTKLGDALGIAGVGRFGPVQVGLGYHRIDAGNVPGVEIPASA